MAVIKTLTNIFVVGYPITISIIWITGCIFFSLFQQRKKEKLIKTTVSPFVSILVPAHNEEETLIKAVSSLASLEYPYYELVLIDDCSQDQTNRVMHNLKKEFSDLSISIVTLPINKGKAYALNEGLRMAKGTDIVVIDSDCILAPDAVTQLIKKLHQCKDYGAVTGKPVVRNRSTLLGRLQLLEYIGVIDVIKKAQLYLTGSITTVSGVIVAFRRDALQDVDGWNPEVMTEDIDITWRLYHQNWRVSYEPKAICWILVPEHLFGLLKQRQRWSRGGLEVLFSNWRGLYQNVWGQRILLLETIMSNLWAVVTSLSVVNYLIKVILLHSLNLNGNLLMIMFVTSAFQFIVGFISSHIIANLSVSELSLVPIYMLYYWIINLVSCLTAMASYFIDPKRRGTWHSPDRGV